MKKLLLVITICLSLVAFYLLYLRNHQENSLVSEGNLIVQKIEFFRQTKHLLPNSFKEMGIEMKEEGPFYYNRIDSINFTISFGTSLGESKIYYSDSKRWEDHLRSMKIIEK